MAMKGPREGLRGVHEGIAGLGAGEGNISASYEKPGEYYGQTFKSVLRKFQGSYDYSQCHGLAKECYKSELSIIYCHLACSTCSGAERRNFSFHLRRLQISEYGELKWIVLPDKVSRAHAVKFVL